MTTLHDLLHTLDAHADLAPGPTGLVEAARTGAARIRRRRRVVAAVTAAVSVVAVATGVTAVRHLESAPPPSPPATVEGPRQATDVSVTTTEGSGLFVNEHSLYADWQGLTLSRQPALSDDSTGPTWGVRVWDPGAFDPATLPAGEPVKVGDRDGQVVPGLDKAVVERFRKNGAGRTLVPALAWSTADGSWVTLTGHRMLGEGGDAAPYRAELLQVAAALRFGPTVRLPSPIQLSWLPGRAGVFASSTSASLLLPVMSIQLAEPGTKDPDPPVTISGYRLDATGLPAQSELGAGTETVQGFPAWYESRQRGGEYVVRTPHCSITMRQDKPFLTREEMKRILDTARFADCADRGTWLPIVP